MLKRFFNWLMTRIPGPPKPNTEPQDTLLKRNEIWVTCEVRRFDPLAQVRKGWGSKLKLLFSQYLTGKYKDKEKWQKQALQTLLHELMHIALWDVSGKGITHSQDETSLLHEYIDGSKSQPNEWDLQVMKEAAKRIDAIYIEGTDIREYEVWPTLCSAIDLWNSWINKNLFILSYMEN